ncbi:hypothetical protein H634G_10975, partial [Metarhizium anisopliae BRIP 53293]
MRNIILHSANLLTIAVAIEGIVIPGNPTFEVNTVPSNTAVDSDNSWVSLSIVSAAKDGLVTMVPVRKDLKALRKDHNTQSHGEDDQSLKTRNNYIPSTPANGGNGGEDGAPGAPGAPANDGNGGEGGAPGAPGGQGGPSNGGALGAPGAPANGGNGGEDGAPGAPGAPANGGDGGEDGAPGAPGAPGNGGNG